MLLVERQGEKVLDVIGQTDSVEDRSKTALVCAGSLDLSIPTVVDGDENAVNAAYAGWPDRLVVVGADGKIAYYGGMGPGGFKPNEVENWLKMQPFK